MEWKHTTMLNLIWLHKKHRRGRKLMAYKKNDGGLSGMIERSEEMIPRKNNVLSPKGVWDKKPEETEKIMGNTLNNTMMSNNYYKKAKDFFKEE
jgi:hypothetical protein